MLRGLMEKVENVQEQLGNVSREVETLKKESEGNARNEKHCNEDEEKAFLLMDLSVDWTWSQGKNQ